MSALTGALYAALVIYLGGWLADKWIGNFALLLLLLTLVTFAYWLAERLYFAPRRQKAAAVFESQEAARRADLTRQGIQVDGEVDDVKARLLQQPWWLDWTAGLFPVIAVVFVLRSFLFEPFKIPSGSMIPTLQVGDLILVNKFHYGIRLPVINKKIIPNHDPARGDVMVFHYPMNPQVDYIKRVVGLPGDEVSYLNKQLRINGELVPEAPLPDYYVDERHVYERAFVEDLKGVKHQILNDPDRPSGVTPFNGFPFKDNCQYSAEGVVCKVPANHYFMMGDHRDDSQDSRYWGFVPDENIVGRAFFVWMNFGDLGRIGSFH
ncbi:MAG: signal peptidase I [Caulobacter sp.]|nr:signal peptidase I [Vitreoscilla sp.]